MSLPIILSCDPGTDDAAALLTAAAYLKEDLRCVMASYGNVGIDNTYVNALDLAALLGLDCPVVPSSAGPLGSLKEDASFFHGENGLGGVILPHAPLPKKTSDPFKYAADLIKSLGRCVFVLTGPLTDAAVLLSRFPEIKENIEYLLIMGGGYEKHNMPGKTEFNFYSDGRAVKEIFDSGVPIVLAPLDFTRATALSSEELKSITDASTSEKAALMAAIMRAGYENCVRYGEGGAVFHDASTLLYLAEPSAYETQELPTSADPSGRIAEDIDGKTIKVIKSVDKRRYISLLKDAFSAL